MPDNCYTEKSVENYAFSKSERNSYSPFLVILLINAKLYESYFFCKDSYLFIIPHSSTI